MTLLQRLRYWCAKPYLMATVGQCTLIAREEAGRAYQLGFHDGWNGFAKALDEYQVEAGPKAKAVSKVLH